MFFNLQYKSPSMILAQSADDDFALIEPTDAVLWAAALAGDFGAIEPLYEPPEPSEAELEEARKTRDLSRSGFEWLLAYSGLDGIWDALQTAALDAGDRATYASLREQRMKSTYPLADTLAWVAAYRDQAALIDPALDLSDDAIKLFWEAAATRGDA